MGERHLRGTYLVVKQEAAFGNQVAVANVEYKLLDAAWSRPDLAELDARADDLKSTLAAVIAFRPRGNQSCGQSSWDKP